MFKRITRIISMVLTVLLLMQLLPAEALAAERLEIGEMVTIPTQTLDSSEEVHIIAELTDKRTEYSKEYLLSNGLHMASVYANAIHYEEDGQWKDIDNTLRRVGTGDDAAYANTQGIWDVTLPQELSPGKGVTLTKDGYSLTFYMTGELEAPSLEVMSEDPGEAPLALTEAQPAQAQVQVAEDNTQAEEQYPETALDTLHSRLCYDNVYADTTVVYDLTSHRLKESVILERYSDTLRGYRYTLDTGDLTAVLADSGEIAFLGKNSKEPVMIMEAPFLQDNAGAYSADVEVRLEKTGDTYTLEYLLPQSWLAAEDRQWPVILDPVVSAPVSYANIEDRSVFSDGWSGPGDTLLQCGNGGNGLGVMRFYIRYKELPPIDASDVIVGATAQLYKVYDYGNTTPVEVHKVTDSWEEQTITWNNPAGFSAKVEDFAICKERGFYQWDVTDLVRSWYEEENNGMMFKASDDAETDTTQNMQRFASSDYYTYDNNERPQLLITFRNNNGLESYWDYTSASAGRAGTAHINNYSGNLVWVRGDMGYGGCLMPVSISHVYNSNYSAPDDPNKKADLSITRDFSMGNGWRTNYNQLVYNWGNENAVTTYYVWEDGDGTAHYFYPDTENENTYLDEDGLELTLTLEDSGYILTDKLGNTSYFDEAGRLVELKNNQQVPSSILIAYDSAGRISTITDSANRDYVFTYNDDGKLRKIDYQGSGEEPMDTVQFGYNTTGQLISVTDPDGKVSTYTYGAAETTNDHSIPDLLVSARDSEGYTLQFSYSRKVLGKPARVASVKEFHDTTPGGKLDFTYQKNQTTLTDHNGNVQILQFNNLGNTLSIRDDEGRAQYAQYAINGSSQAEAAESTESTGKANQLTLSSKLQNTVVNLLPQGSFEDTQPWQGFSGASVSFSADAYIGSKAMKVTGAASGETVGASGAAIPVEQGKVYTFSAYVKIENASAYLALENGGEIALSQALTNQEGWVRLQVSCTAQANTLTPKVMAEGAGSVYIDCVQVEQAPTASRYNLVENGDFRSTNGWIASTGRVIDQDTAAPALSGDVYKLSGISNAASRLSQTIQVSGKKGECFVLGGWAKGDSVPLGEHYGVNRQFGIIATFYSGQTQVGDSQIVSFHPYLGVDYWQSASAPLVAEGDFTHIEVELAYDYNCNEAFFDGIQLFREEFGSSYAYDSKGNVQSVKNIQGANTVYYYDEATGDLLKVWYNVPADQVPQEGQEVVGQTPDMTYTYDTHHNVTRTVSKDGITTAYTYDQWGNVTQVAVTEAGSTVPMVTNSTYSEDGNLLVSTQDAAGNLTHYGYDPETGLLEWVQYPNDTEATRTEYTYEEDTYRVQGVSADIDADTTLSVGYTYEKDLLKTIVTPSTTYNFTHGDFGLRTNIQVGSQTLASYEYTNDRNFYLKKLAYGNADMVEYTYDDQGRVTSQVYENGDTLTYRYDNTGALATVTDSATGRTTTYYYDFTDRLMQYVETGEGYSHSVGYAYDAINQLTALVETINGTAYTTEYGYDENYRLSTVTDSGSGQTLTYDGYGRVEKKEVTRDGRTILTVEYAYRDSTADSPGTTGQIASITVGTNGASRGYTYTYDANGNILSVTEGNETTSYTYDKAGQLLRENNQAAGKTWVWEYDDAGNIETRTEYAYTTGSLGAVLDTVTYAYDNDNWGDLLTSYDGQTITYDQIGNPLNDGTWEYTWEHGRQLSSMTDGTVTLNYEYNADGIRTKKTVSTASDHSHIFQARVVAPTCTENGYTLHECACGFSWQSDPVVSTGHTFTTTQVDATCTEHGYTLKACACGYSYQDGTSGHTFTDTVVAPTADSNGYTLHECACGYSYQDTPVAALGIANSSAGEAANTVVYDYVYNGSSLTYLTITTSNYGENDPVTDTLYFGSGTVTYNGTVYYYVTNLQGDVVAILNADGNPVVQYTYDAWGKILSISGPMADTLGAVNPLTYRGYVYDTETDLYYLESRYYDPAVGRFINGDAFASTGGLLGNNMFAYCLNNPEMYTDPSGQCPHDGKFYTSGPFEGQFEYNPSCVLCAAHGEFWVQAASGESIDAYSDQPLLNAHIIYDYLIQQGFSSNSASAVLGNMHHESGLDPSKHQYGGNGYGLAQWDPASKYTDWASANGYSHNSLYGQLEYLLYSMQPGRGEWFSNPYYPQYYLSCNNFISSTDSVSFLTQVFCFSYERPGILHMDRRISHAQYWYNYFN